MEKDLKVLEKLASRTYKIDEDGWETAVCSIDEQLAIRNLIARNKELEEDNYAYHQLMQMQNKREYRSKFLKDFKAEYGENVMPDYDEIYKRYDKMKKQLENSIPKSKVQEVLDEYGKQIIEDNTVIRFYKAIQNLVQEGDK